MHNETHIVVPMSKLLTNSSNPVKSKLRLSPGLKLLAEAYLYEKLKSKDLAERVFTN